VIAVVRANDLNLIQLQGSIRGLSPNSSGIAAQNWSTQWPRECENSSNPSECPLVS
jgi:hypothetical protein